MGRRLLAFAIASGVFGTPVVSEFCKTRCADYASDPAAAQASAGHDHHPGDPPAETHPRHHHAFTEVAATTTTSTVTSLTHACDHADAVITASQRLRLAAASVNALAARVSPTLVVCASVIAIESRHGPPGTARTSSPLRI